MLGRTKAYADRTPRCGDAVRDLLKLRSVLGYNHSLGNRPHRMTGPTMPAPAPLAQRAAALCLDLKANDVVVIASGTSDTHVRSVAEHVLEELRKEGTRAHHVEGVQQGRWVLLDYVDMVVHIFHPTLREFYQLERLWSDAAVVAVDQQQGVLK